MRRAPGRVTRWCVRAHRWAALALGLLFLLQATSGAVLLYGSDIARVLHPERYTVTPSIAPMNPLAALRMVQASHPELDATGVQTYQGVYLVRGPGASPTHTDAFVDPGSGRINGIGRELPWFVLLLLNAHTCAFTCEGLPGHLPWLATPLPGAFGEDTGVGSWLLGAVGTAVILLAVSGVIIWWPGLRALATGFIVRRGRGRYVRDLDLHRLVGIVVAPFLLFWGVTGAAFVFDWPERAYFALLPGEARPSAAEPTTVIGPPLTAEQAQAEVLGLHPTAEVLGISVEGNGYRFRLRDGFDPYQYSNFAGNHSARVDSDRGVWDDRTTGAGPFTERLWNDGVLNGLHFGTAVSPLPRVTWLVLALSPVLLGITGLSVWLTKRRSARNRRHRRTAAAR